MGSGSSHSKDCSATHQPPISKSEKYNCVPSKSSAFTSDNPHTAQSNSAVCSKTPLTGKGTPLEKEFHSNFITCEPPLDSFHDAIATASAQLRIRQWNGNSYLTKEEMDDLVVLTREIENVKHMIKRSQYTVEGTWSILEKEGALDRFGQQLYNELLTKNPLLRVYFYGVDLDEQSKALIRMLSTAVHFYDKPHVTFDMFTKAGARHRGYGVSIETLMEMRTAFFEVFPKFVGADVAKVAEGEWRNFWKIIVELLEYGSKSPEGERYAKIYEQELLKKLQADFNIIIERQSKCDSRHQFVGIMYSKAIEMYGDLSKFDALYDIGFSKRVFQSFIDIIVNSEDEEKSSQYLAELGAGYAAYNISVEDLNSFTEPFMFTCRHFLQEEWNVAMESRFKWGFQCMVETVFPLL